jgi:hypothetical protein
MNHKVLTLDARGTTRKARSEFLRAFLREGYAELAQDCSLCQERMKCVTKGCKAKEPPSIYAAPATSGSSYLGSGSGISLSGPQQTAFTLNPAASFTIMDDTMLDNTMLDNSLHVDGPSIFKGTIEIRGGCPNFKTIGGKNVEGEIRGTSGEDKS